MAKKVITENDKEYAEIAKCIKDMYIAQDTHIRLTEDKCECGCEDTEEVWLA